MFEHPPPVSEADGLDSPDAVVAELATSLPRGDDVAALLMLEPEALSDAGRVDLLVAFERSIALLQAAQQQVLASLDGRALDWSGKKLIDYTREQVGAALRLSPGTAERRLSIARTLIERLPAEGAALIETVLNSLASGQTDDRSADQRRADALVEVFARVLADPSLPEQHGKRPAIQVSVPLRTLLGGDNQPAHPDGYGPITAALAHRLAADQSGTWRRLVTDDTSQLLDYGRKTYRPPANLTNHLIARDRACTFPGRRRAAKLCDLDHVQAWTDGGDTNPANVAALCARHHAKHDAGWQVKHRQDGTKTWTSPTGHTYIRAPDG